MSKASDAEYTRKELSRGVAREEAREVLDEDDATVGRRGLLRGAVASVAAFAGLPTTASAQRDVSELERQRALQEFHTPGAVRDAFREHEDTLARLVEEGLLESASIDDYRMDVREHVHPEEDGHGFVLGAVRLGEEVTPKLQYVEKTAAGVVQVVVFPELDHSHAFLNLPDGETEVIGKLPEVPASHCGNNKCYTCSTDTCCNHRCETCLCGCCCTGGCTCCSCTTCGCSCCECGLNCLGQCF